MHWLMDSLQSIPNPAPAPPPGLSKPASLLLSWFKWVAIMGGLAGLTACSLMMIAGRRNRSNMAVEGATGIPWVLAGLAVASLASGLVSAVLG